MTLPADTDLRLRRAMKALDHGGGITDAVIIVFAGGSYQAAGSNEAINIARALRLAADHMERTRPIARKLPR